jgi:hypothetical protein
VAAVAAFVMSSVWYMFFGNELAKVLGKDGARSSNTPPLEVKFTTLNIFLPALNKV